MKPTHTPICSRRHLLGSTAYSLATLGMLDLLKRDGLLASDQKGLAKPNLVPEKFDLLPKQPHFEPKAKAMISIFLLGGPSHIDMFEPKPKLSQLDGKTYGGDIQFDNPAQASRKVLASPWKFKRYGQSGMEMSELIPNIGSIADEITLIRSMHTGVNNHIPSLRALNHGKGVPGRPALGSWLTYALGCESQELPAYVALTDPHGLPIVGGENWANGFLPSLFQGTVARPRDPRILNLDPPDHLRGVPQQAQLTLLREMNEQHLSQHPGEHDLSARMESYALAARMQSAAKEAFDISNESAATKKLYGIDVPETADYGTRCLIARRLIERGVRFVQIWNHGQSWDHHSNIITALPKLCKGVDRPAAALVTDLKSRGLLDSTVVHFGGEMGRLPVIQNDGNRQSLGRDHNTFGFSIWMAGGGFKPGHVHGATDEMGIKAEKDPVSHNDYLTTLLHQFGLHEKDLIYKRNTQQLKLLDGAQGRVLKEILA